MAAVALIGVAGCGQHQEQPEQMATPSASLYERLGGEKNIKAVVDELVPLVLHDPKVDFVRKGTASEFKPTPENLDKLRMHLVQYLCHLTGGPQMYEGKDVKQAHAGLGITEAQFGAFAVDLGRAMDRCKVGPQESEDLLTAIEMSRADIVEKK